MNKSELWFYNLVKKNPRLKIKIRNAYQRLFDFIPARRMATAYEIETHRGFFFGFHDKCPWSVDDKRLLAHRITTPSHMPQPEDELEVGFLSGEKYQDYTRVGTTHSWNWHMGAMLQWVGNSDRIIFNDFDGHSLLARIVEPGKKEVDEIPQPVAAISADGKKALSYNFPRLQKTPHKYGYANGNDPEADLLVPLLHGIHLIDIDSGKARLLFSVADIRMIKPEPSMEMAFHYFSHCQFSPTGNRFIFYHRWSLGDDRLWSRMISSNLMGNDLHFFPTSGMVSHYAWRDDEYVLAYARVQPLGDGYYLFRDRSSEFHPIGRETLRSDGHPSFGLDHRWFTTDTYPDRSRVRSLVLYDMEKNKHYNLARIYSPYKYVNDLRCDLHPRWSRRGAMICFDSTHLGERALCLINLGDDLTKKGEPLSI